MKILFIYPKYPKTYWSFSEILKIIKKKAIFPPLGLLTVASMVPEEWEKKLIDCNVNKLNVEDIRWADLIFISAMIVQKEDTIRIIKSCKAKGKKIVVGGPMFTSMYKEFEKYSIDYFVLDEGEITLPQFLSDLKKGTSKHIYRSTKRPDISKTPIPLWSLINVHDYYGMMMQFSRGCPFNCEFCDIVIMNGRTPRTKSRTQALAELQAIYDLGHRGFFFIVDDNFIGNKIKVKEFLRELIIWQKERDYPFEFLTEASVNLADDIELMELMRDANFKSVFLGIETPSLESLKECGKFQNTKQNLVDSVKKIQHYGMMVMGGFIVGFDSDDNSIFNAQIEFIQKTGITTAMVGMLEALPKTRLWNRLEKEERLLKNATGENTDGKTNFIPKMGMESLIIGYYKVLSTIYKPKNYYSRIYTLIDNYTPVNFNNDDNQLKDKSLINSYSKEDIQIFLRAVHYVGGFLSGNFFRFWKLIIKILRNKPEAMDMAITQAIYGHHFEKITKKVLKNIRKNYPTLSFTN